MVGNKIEEQNTMDRKRSCKHLKKSGVFFQPPEVDAGETLMSAPLTFVPFPFIARALKVLAVLTSVLLVVFIPCYKNSNKILECVC